MDVEPNVEKFSGIGPERVVEAYGARELESFSDRELFRAAASIVAKPKLALSSFTMHAPLEVMARYTLLPLVSPADRELARIQLVATVAHYEARGEAAPSAFQKLPTMRTTEAVAQLRRALQEGNVELADALCLRLADDCGLPAALDSIAASRRLSGYPQSRHRKSGRAHARPRPRIRQRLRHVHSNRRAIHKRL